MKQREIASALNLDLRTIQNYLSENWLRERGLEHLALEAQLTSEPVRIITIKVGPVPDIPTRYTHHLGSAPTSVFVTPTIYGTFAPIFVGEITAQDVQLQSLPLCSGAIGFATLVHNPQPNSIDSLKLLGY